ncbi:MAG: hypothetical protein PHG66_04475 [Candidatus Colwellbacteria bacterium]|nr:hypothetical protein [Candidatus Colwellbacteria bacterium]
MSNPTSSIPTAPVQRKRKLSEMKDSTPEISASPFSFNPFTPGFSATPASAFTPGFSATPASAFTPGFSATPASAFTPGFSATPASALSSSSFKGCDHILTRGVNKGKRCCKMNCALHRNRSVHLYQKFIDRLVEKSVNKTIQGSLSEWRYHSDVENHPKMKCLCGFSRCSNIQYYKNTVNGCIISVGTTCRKHFSESDAKLPKSTRFFTQSGYEKDGFVVDDNTIEMREDEDPRMSEEKYHIDDDIDFEVVSVKEIKGNKCLVQWNVSKISPKMWNSYYGMGYGMGYRNDADTVYRHGNSVYVVWKDTWIDLTREMMDLYYEQRC